jgi:hypothetical protein
MFDRRPSNVFSGGGAAPDRNSTGQTGNKQLRALLHHGQTAKSDLGQDKHPKLIDLAAVWLMEGRRGIAPNIK